ncbi:excinuclease ABC subunit UvrA [Amycolatopsis granulosa]|uniref:excinuclease ABC subunit UvrA n=1 Tax=Amycolatopsis granulosa TaxID=185684 RepID=UPI00141F513E|nr:excinuclease ABC subunit UvrA [Amycolatopsis granulosa]NIH86325.1 excinuclease UvrABC ATPase subunit [Amycolatopsis granulosa]
MTELRVVGAREHNLRDVTVALPKHAFTVVTGVSGSGKSSLVFDTIAAESQRQLGETFTTFVRHRLPRYGQPDVDAIENLSAAIVVDQKRLGGGPRSTVGTVTDIYSLMRLLWSRAGRPFAGYSNAFSFNDPRGMCPRCGGLGTARAIVLDELVDRSRSLNEGAIRFPTFQPGGWMWRTFAESGLFDLDKPLADYDPAEWDAFLHGAPEPAPARYEGLLPRFERIWLPKDADSLKGRTRAAFERVVTQETCPKCHGARLSPEALASTVAGRSIAECAAMEAEDLLTFVRTLTEPAPVVAGLVAQLERLVSIGLGYLTMDRPTSTLSGGESQRVKMVRHLGSSLTDMLYVFDEPSVGLHPDDVTQLVALLKSLRDKGNTVLVVEHDPDVITAADHVVDLGPGAGQDGGRVVYQGAVAGLADTPTGRYLRHRPRIKENPRPAERFLQIRGATRHNLRGVDADIPLGVLTVVTGVAGSGKSTLVHGFVPDAVSVDQSPIRGSRRSSPATFTGMLDGIRQRFAAANGVSPSLFSANSAGACPRCHGLGVLYTDLAFLDPVVSTCEECEGRRFVEDVLRYTYRGRTISEVLDLSARDAREVFPDEPVLDRLVEVGIGYLSLGQPLNTLSGGERQRLKLAVELARPGRTYVFDEPTTGLHPADVAGLIELFDRLVSAGSTVVVIEHNLDVIARADWIVDIGPGPGRHGGRVLFQGPPAELVRQERSTTGRHLARLSGNR